MKLVREHIGFKRGIEPRETMDIGYYDWTHLKNGDIIVGIWKDFVNDAPHASTTTYYGVILQKRILNGELQLFMAMTDRKEQALEVSKTKGGTKARMKFLNAPEYLSGLQMSFPIEKWDEKFTIIKT